MTTTKYTTKNNYNRNAETSMVVGHARCWAIGFINHSDCDGRLAELSRKRRVKEGGRLAHLPMGCERMAASVPAFRSSLANSGKMPALLEAGASRMPTSHCPKNGYKDQGWAVAELQQIIAAPWP